MAVDPVLDDVNRRLIAELQADGRLSLAELGRRVRLSPPAVAERVERLRREGVIAGVHAHVDPAALGHPLGAVVRVRPAPRQIATVARQARETREVVECHRITGEDCFYLKLHLRSIDELGGVLDRFLDFGETTTSIVNATPVPRRDPPLG